MGVKLYKKTDSGVDMKVFRPERMDGALSEGWAISETGSDAKKIHVIDKGSTEVLGDIFTKPTREEVDTNSSGKLSNKEVRQAAKKARIVGWDKKRITALKEELGL